MELPLANHRTYTKNTTTTTQQREQHQHNQPFFIAIIYTVL